MFQSSDLYDWLVLQKINFWPRDIIFSPAKRNVWKMKLWRKGTKGSLKLVWFHITWPQEWKRKAEVLHVRMIVFIHLHCPIPTNASTRVNKYILNLVRNIRISLRLRRRTNNTMCLKGHLMKIWLKLEKWWKLKMMVFTCMFHLYFIHQLLRRVGLMQHFLRD